MYYTLIHLVYKYNYIMFRFFSSLIRDIKNWAYADCVFSLNRNQYLHSYEQNRKFEKIIRKCNPFRRIWQKADILEPKRGLLRYKLKFNIIKLLIAKVQNKNVTISPLKLWMPVQILLEFKFNPHPSLKPWLCICYFLVLL